MIVCMCKGISDKTIRKLAQDGASSPSQIRLACAAGTCCGGCRQTIVQILESERPFPKSRLASAS